MIGIRSKKLAEAQQRPRKMPRHVDLAAHSNGFFEMAS